MQTFIITLLTCSVTMSVLALLYMAGTPILARRYSEKGRYYAWLIIVAGLIVPFRPQWGGAIVKMGVPEVAAAPVVQIGNGTPVEIPIFMPAIGAAPSPEASSFSWWPWWQVAAAVWLAGAVVFLAYHAVKHYRFVKTANRWSESVKDKQAMALFQNLKEEMGITKRIGLYSCPCVDSPMMVGLAKPRILLTTAVPDKDELRFILKHELVHYKRKDLLYKYLVLTATAIHWFNPAVYQMAKAIDTLCEVSCDTEVVRSTDIDTRMFYSETIIGVAKYQSKLKTVLSTNFFGGKKGMKNRISSIMDMSNKKAGVAIVIAALLVTTTTGFAFAVNGKPVDSAPKALSNPVLTTDVVTISDLVTFWDTGWGDDEFIIQYKFESTKPVSEFGIRAWDEDGDEIKYLDGSSHSREEYEKNGYDFPDLSDKVYSCIYAIDNDGAHLGSLVLGKTYYYKAYVVCEGKRYETPAQQFVFSDNGARYGGSRTLQYLTPANQEYYEKLEYRNDTEKVTADLMMLYMQYGLTWDSNTVWCAVHGREHSNWWFNGKRVDLFADGDSLPIACVTKGGSSPQDTIGVKVIRNADGEIVKLAQMTDSDRSAVIEKITADADTVAAN